MTNEQRFFLARSRVLSEHTHSEGIGTLGEKTMHRILKSYIEPNEDFHEIKFLGSVADIKNSEGVFEIQTASYEKLIPKLRKMLDNSEVTVVCPIIESKTVRFINKDTGEISSAKKSPKHESALDALRKLYRIKDFLNHKNLRVRLIYLVAEEYRYLDGWDKTKKKGATRLERIPVAILDDVVVSSTKEYSAFFPNNLGEYFTAKEFSKAIKRTDRYAYPILRFFSHFGFIEHARTEGRKFIYKKI